MVRLTDHLDMTIVVNWDVKPQNKVLENREWFILNLFSCE